jgi:hypothetical protein
LSTGSWLVLIAFEAVLLATLPQVRRLWRGEPSRFDGRPVRWLRAIPVLLVSGALFLPLVMATAAFGDTERATTASALLVVPTLVLMFVGPALSIMLWRRGRPRRLVPPRLRDDPPRKTPRRQPRPTRAG